MADEGEDITEHLVKKYGQQGLTNFGNPDSHLFRAGRAVGIQFTSDRNVYPTVKAHALMEHVKKTDNDKANQIMEKMYHLYFEKGENINSVDLLAGIASQVGVDTQEAKQAMENDDLQEKVRLKDRNAKRNMGVSGVPFYIIERNDGSRPVSFSGAQPPDIIAEQLEAAAEE
jgi:predicted DsbA family dithiol-disulfide isomerase